MSQSELFDDLPVPESARLKPVGSKPEGDARIVCVWPVDKDGWDPWVETWELELGIELYGPNWKPVWVVWDC